MFSRRLDPRSLLALLRGLSAWKAGLAILCGLLVVPAQPAWPLATWLVFVPLGTALWYLAFDGLARLLAPVTDPVLRPAAHLLVVFGAMWVMRLTEPLVWLYAFAAVAAVVYALAGAACRRRVRARVL